jgi:type I restriction enzyme R subunit
MRNPALPARASIGEGKKTHAAVAKEDRVALSQVIDVINDRFGTDFNQADQLFFDQIIAVASESEELQQAA